MISPQGEYKMEGKAEPEFIDAETQWKSDKDDISFRYVVLKHLMKITLLGSVEFRGGYWQQKTKVSKEGGSYTEKVYIPDTREEYGNAINVFYDLLIPHFDSEMVKKGDEINKSMDELRIKCIDATSLDETKILGTKKEDTAILSMDTYEGKDRRVIEAYRFAKCRAIRSLFQELSKFLKRIDYLGAQSLTE